MATGFHTPSEFPLNGHSPNAPQQLGRMRGIEKILGKIGIGVAALFGVAVIGDRIVRPEVYSGLATTDANNAEARASEAKTLRLLNEQINALQQQIDGCSNPAILAEASAQLDVILNNLQFPNEDFLPERSAMCGKLGEIALEIKNLNTARGAFNRAHFYAETAGMDPTAQEWYSASESVPPLDPQELYRQMREKFGTPEISTDTGTPLASAGGGAE